MTQKEAIAARKEAEHKLATLTATVEAKALERTLALIESPQPVPVPWREYPGYDDWGMGAGTPYDRPYIWTNVDDRTEGRYLPLYENAHDVRRIRAEARKLVELFPVAKGALQKLSDYVMGTGWDFEVQPIKRYKNDPLAIQLAGIIQGVVDTFLEYNNFIGNLDREIHEESRIDGDILPTLYPEDDQVRIELTDPGCILEPANPNALERMLGCSHKLSGWWHGVHTVYNKQLRRDDVTRPLGYHAVFDRVGDQWDYLPVSRVEHVKRNVGPLARVGVSDFLTVQQDLENEGKIRRNTAVGAAILAAIVMIRQHAEGTSKSSIESMVATNATSTYERPIQGGSRTTNVENTRPGTIKDTPAGMETTLGALGTLRSPVYIEVAKYLQSVIGQPWSMPYFLISGDGSEGNYASTLVSESPFIKYCEHEQASYAGHFERLIWKALRMYCELGAFRGYSWQQICTYLEIVSEYSSPASRDRAEQAITNETLVRNGIMSKRTWASDSGLDYDEEQQKIKEGSADDGADGVEQVQLNGLQVTAASEILHQVSAGETAELVAIGLLQGIGLPASLARQMVKAATAKAGEVQAKQAAEKEAQARNGFGKPGENGPPFDKSAYEARTESLARNAIQVLLKEAESHE